MDKIFIADLERELGRNDRTIRAWVRDAQKMADAVGREELPEEYLQSDLWPHQEEGGRRRTYWTDDQVAGLKEFAAGQIERSGWRRKPCGRCGQPKTSDVHRRREKGGTCEYEPTR